MLIANFADILKIIIYSYVVCKIKNYFVSVPLLKPFIGWSDSSASSSVCGQEGSPYCTN